MRKSSCDNKNAVLSFYVCFSGLCVDIKHAVSRITSEFSQKQSSEMTYTKTKFREIGVFRTPTIS